MIFHDFSAAHGSTGFIRFQWWSMIFEFSIYESILYTHCRFSSNGVQVDLCSHHISQKEEQQTKWTLSSHPVPSVGLWQKERPRRGGLWSTARQVRDRASSIKQEGTHVHLMHHSQAIQITSNYIKLRHMISGWSILDPWLSACSGRPCTCIQYNSHSIHMLYCAYASTSLSNSVHKTELWWFVSEWLAKPGEVNLWSEWNFDDPRWLPGRACAARWSTSQNNFTVAAGESHRKRLKLKARLKNWFPAQNTKLDQIGRSWQRWTTYWDFQLSFGIRLDSIQHGSTWEAPRCYSLKTLCCTSVVNVWDFDLLRSVRSNTLFSSHLTIKEVKLKEAFHMHDRRPLQN